MALKHFNPERIKMHISVLDKFARGGSVFVDRRRSRPRWFDGRFLKAADLNRETNYFLTRQADLAVATGTGVVEGLHVREHSATSVRISQGHGMTFDGERVFLPNDITISLHNISLAQELNVKLGLSRRPAPPDRSRSGIYIIALRPLEFTANPTASYPVDVDGKREMRDGSIVEATAVNLIPYSYPAGAAKSKESRRAQVAHQVFSENSEYRFPSSTLPLAMVEMRRGRLLWLDNYMVRRDMGSVYSDVLGFGFAPRPLRRSHFKQYDHMIEEIVEDRKRAGTNLRFAAAEYFVSLPSAGRLPSACVDLNTFTQFYFPDAMDVEMSIIPEDEMAMLVEESILLPPVLLNEEEGALAANSIMILLPVPRQVFYGMTRKLKRLPTPLRFPIKKVRSRFKPKDYLHLFQAKLPDFQAPAIKNEDALKEVAWKSLLAKEQYVWYVRRRNLSYKDEVTGTAIHVMTNEHKDETNMRKYQRTLKLYDDFTHLKVRGSAAADLEMVRLLTIPKFTKSEILMRSTLKEFGATEKLDERHAASISLRFGHRLIGKGLDRIEKKIFKGSDDDKTEQKKKLAEALRVPELDFIARVLSKEEVDLLSEELHTLLKSPNKTPEHIAKFILTKKEELEK